MVMKMDKEKTWIESLIQEIEECKSIAYEAIAYAEGMENPDVLAQHTNRLLGMQTAYDVVIKHLRKRQGVITDAD